MAIRAILCAAAGLSMLAGCASNEVKKPKNEVNTAEHAVRNARQANAYEFASFEMTAADRKLDQAQSLATSDKDSDRLRARRLAEQATLDARLAEAKARLAQAQSTKTQMTETVDVLRKEAERVPGGTP
jgi:uncharacterized lipoprotein YajG